MARKRLNLKKAINPAHKNWCTPMSKPTCTGHRRALAKRLKPGGDLHNSSNKKKTSRTKKRK